MKCPHFQKVNFQKIKQVKNDQSTVQDQNCEGLNYSIFSIESLSQEIYDLPQQSPNQANNFRNKISTYRHSFKSLYDKEDSIKEFSKIKMPKQMNVKKMITSSGSNIQEKQAIQRCSEVQEQEQSIFQQRNSNFQEVQIPSEHQNSNNRKNPHILVSKTSMLTQESFQIFNGIVFLSSRQENMFQCEIKQNIIKISKDQKIKYFIELKKVKTSIQFVKQNQRAIRITLKCKNKEDNINLYFISPFQKQIFYEVYSTCVKALKQDKKSKKVLQEDKENIGHSTNSFNEDDEESEILNQKNQLNSNQSSSSLSSLSITTYEGDSLVFQTQRMLFSQLKESGNTFDVLLFKNKSLMSKMQRIFTNSDYDHTALLLRTASNDLLMLEATSNAGVAIYTFNSLMRIDKSKYFSRIGLRKYNGEKNLNKISRLQNFIRKTVGKKYKFDPMYLIKSEANEQKQTFFCSELVAEALQDVGILSNQFPSFKYLPKHFGDDNFNNQVIDGRFSDVIILE